jgi:N-acetylneuraminic acid mutarotase
MQRHVLGPLPLLAALVAISVSGCRGAEESTGSAQFVSQLQQSLSASEVSRVTVTLTAADLPTRTVELEKTQGQWGGLMGHIPSGPGRTFTAEAFRADGTTLYSGQVTDVTITKGRTAAVALVLQQVQARPPFQNAIPIIDSLVASGSSAPPGGRITLQASAHDPNPGDTLTYAWTASGGTLASPTSATTEWMAPQQAGQVTLTLAVTDPHGSVATLSLKVTVRNGVGDAALDISFNDWPVVSRLTASPSRVEVGQSTVVTVTASDSDGDALGYQWSAEGCTGTWTEASGHTARFTPDAAPVDGPCGCRLGVQVRDGRGGLGTGTLSMCVGGATAPSFPPEVVETFQSAATVSAHGTVRLRVEGQDPQGGALGFSWTADAGTLGEATSNATTSERVWSAPACLDALDASITVTLSNTVGLTTSHVFRVHGLPECTPLPSGTWAAVGGLNMSRSWHSATLLPSGEVLFAGSMPWGPPWGSLAEVYDPKTHRSVGTVSGPHGMTAAVLLPTGKVLAIGLSSAQLFDPVTKRWSAAGAVASAEFHTATLLPSSGKVLLAGGHDTGTSQQLAAARLYDVATGAWTDTQPMLSARAGHSATVLPSGKVLVTGGYGPEDVTGTTTEVYDPATGSWTPAGSMAFGRTHHSALLLPSGKVLVVGGSWNQQPSLAEVYDPETDTWLPAGGGASTCMKSTATLLPSGKVLVTGCKSQPSRVTTADVYDPMTGVWVPTGQLNVPRDFYTATLLPSGRVLVAGGATASMMEEYDPATGAWSPLGARARKRSGHTAVLLPSGKVLVMGGAGEDGPLTELYDPATTAWTETGAMGSPRSAHTATLLPSGLVMVVGGHDPNNNRLATAEVYDPATGTWTPTGSLSVGRSGHTATLLRSGRVLVVGGNDLSGSTPATAEVYDPATGTWSSTGGPNVGRAGHTATLLPSGLVLVVGGGSSRVEVYDPVLETWTLKAELHMNSNLTATLLASGRVLIVTNGALQSSVVEYDPETDTVEGVAEPVQPRESHTATLLASGKVLIAGGEPPTTVTELYDPETRTWSSTGDFSSFRMRHTATRLASGKVLVVGGHLAGTYYSLATVYTP